MRIRRTIRPGLAAVLGFVLGAVVTLSLQGPGQAAQHRGGGTEPTPQARLLIRPEPARTFLAWTPGGLPANFRRAVRTLPRIKRSVVVASDTAWMTRSFAADGTVVDTPPAGYRIPIEVAAVDPREYAAFLPPADRSLVVALAQGEGVLGSTSAQVRGFGQGGELDFGRTAISVAAVLPDELVGANELLVSRRTGLALGVTRDRYALLQPGPGVGKAQLTTILRTILPPGLPLRVRAPGETPYFRQGDAVLPPVKLKELFGEFAARPEGGFLRIDPAWLAQHIVTEHVPILGDVRCNRGLFPQLRAALGEVVRDGLAGEIKRTEYGGCFGPGFSNLQPELGISHHAWGVAIRIDVAENPYGRRPTMDPRIVSIFERWGFIWGGDFLVPFGAHFEFGRFVRP